MHNALFNNLTFGSELIKPVEDHKQISLGLYFTGGDSPELYRSVFKHPETDILVARRGRSSEGAGGFPWTQAVQAVSYFLLKSLIHSLMYHGADSSFALSGKKGSVASSIIYALQKSNSWMFDMFGSNIHGQPLIKSFLDIENIALRNLRPATITFKNSSNIVKNITVYIEESSVRDISILESLATSILQSFDSAVQNSSGKFSKLTAKEAKNRSRSLPLKNQSDNKVDRIEQCFNEALGGSCSFAFKNKRLAFLSEQEAKGSLVTPFLEIAWKSYLENEILLELGLALSRTNIFSKEKVVNLTESLTKNKNFTKLSAGKKLLTHKIDNDLSGARRVGVFAEDEYLQKFLSQNNQAINICLSASQIGALAIFYYMKYVKGFNLNINLRFAHSSAICEFIQKEHFLHEPDVCCLSILPTAGFLGAQNTYQPFMFMPSISYKLLAPKCDEASKFRIAEQNELYVHHNELSTSRYFLTELVDAKVIKKNSYKLLTCNPQTIVSSFSDFSADSRAVLCFPYANFAGALSKAKIANSVNNFKSHLETVSFVSSKFLKNEKFALLFNVAVRDAWMSLRSSEKLRLAIVKMIMENRDYVSLISRYSGMSEVVMETKAVSFAPLLESRSNSSSELSHSSR